MLTKSIFKSSVTLLIAPVNLHPVYSLGVSGDVSVCAGCGGGLRRDRARLLIKRRTRMVVYDVYRGIGVIDKALCYLWKTFLADKVVKAQPSPPRTILGKKQGLCEC